MTQRNTGSKFSGLLAAVKDREEKDREEPETPAEQESPLPVLAAAQATDAGQPPLAEAKRGRPRGKRSNDDFVQVTAYIGRDTHRAVKMALLGVGEDREFSELVEELLAKWLQSGR